MKVLNSMGKKLSGRSLPISSIYLETIDRVPLSLCLIGGITLNINFIECSYECFFCPWEANLNIRSANVVNINIEHLALAIHRYKPDLVFLNGGDFWRFENIDDFTQEILDFRIPKGLKIVLPTPAYPLSHRIDCFAELFDVILVEVNSFSDISTTYSFIEKFVNDKHVEVIVVAENLKAVKDKVKGLVNNLLKKSIYVPINMFINEYDEVEFYGFIDSVKTMYPLIHSLLLKISECSSILCPRCRNPVVVRQGFQLLKTSIGNDCRCKYCGSKVVTSSKSLCIAKRVVKIPIRIPIV